MLNIIVAAQGEPSFWHSLLTDIPLDPGAIFVYLLVLGSIGLVWYGSRKKV